jgi:Vps54-like protein
MFQCYLSLKQVVMLVQFNKLKRDHQEHQNEIHAKLTAIMGDRLAAHIKTLNTIKWDVPHKVLSCYLPSVVVGVRSHTNPALSSQMS